ncbi:zinc-binding dehydrogenase [Amycolatopsis sp. NPDC051758]|uniref:zinc-binding dehydrogenase n=1 Tax=Amycolatopsis sp. NPDC051758 TaxID=3363935 RepID=UPI0037A7FAC2
MVIVGAGPIIVVDKEPARLDAAKSFGVDVSVQPGEAAAAVAEASGGLGADVVIEAVGIPETFELCTKLVRPGGHVANVGVHGAPAPRGAVDQERHRHHRAGRHVQHARVALFRG